MSIERRHYYPQIDEYYFQKMSDNTWNWVLSNGDSCSTKSISLHSTTSLLYCLKQYLPPFLPPPPLARLPTTSWHFLSVLPFPSFFLRLQTGDKPELRNLFPFDTLNIRYLLHMLSHSFLFVHSNTWLFRVTVSLNKLQSHLALSVHIDRSIVQTVYRRSSPLH